MKKILFLLFALAVLPVSVQAQQAVIKIDVDRKIGEIDPKIYGVFMEPIHFDPQRFGIEDAEPGNIFYC
jgi:alpha-N-arabinofuranosidase